MGYRPPPPPPTALEQLKTSYACGLSFDVFEERLEYLLANGLGEERTPMPWQIPEPGGLPAAERR